MPKVWLPTKPDQTGFSVVEVLLASTVFAMLVVGLVGAIIYGRSSTATAGNRARASAIAEEGVEAIRTIRNTAFTNLIDGTYGLAQVANKWTLSGTQDTTDIYTRQIIVATNGANRKTVTSRVTWPQGSTTAQLDVTSLLANGLGAIAAVKTWSNAVFSGSYDSASTNNAVKVATVGNYAYVVRADGTPDFLILNISNPAAPTLVGSLSLTGIPTNIYVSGNYAYVTNSIDTGELQIINITNPAAPVVSSTYNASGAGDGLGVFVVGNLAYVSRGSNLGTAEFIILNVATPTAPTLTGSYGNANNLREVWVNGNYAYIATDSDTQEMLVVNVTSPAAPTLAGSLNMTGTTNATTIDGVGNTVFVGQGATLQAINVTTPATPTVTKSLATTGGGIINDIAVDAANNWVFLGTASTAAEFQTVDISVIANMVISDFVDLSGITSSLGGVAYNAAQSIVVGASASDTQEVVTFIKS